ncbi:hypothetical protein ACTMU2_07670 [Cupriavidus basilensis]
MPGVDHYHTALGSYTCTLKAGETAPFFVVVTDPTGNTPALVSVATTTPAAGASLTVNVTPLTTAIVAQLSADGNAMSVVNSKQVDAATLQQVVSNVLAQLSQVLSLVAPRLTTIPSAQASLPPRHPVSATTADQVLDIVKVVTNPATGKLALTTVDNPTPVDMATASSSGTQLRTSLLRVWHRCRKRLSSWRRRSMHALPFRLRNACWHATPA